MEVDATFYATIAQVMATFAAIVGGFVVVLGAEMVETARDLRHRATELVNEGTALRDRTREEAERLRAVDLTAFNPNPEAFARLLQADLDEDQYQEVRNTHRADMRVQRDAEMESLQADIDRLAEIDQEVADIREQLTRAQRQGRRFLIASLAFIALVFAGVVWPVTMIAEQSEGRLTRANYIFIVLVAGCMLSLLLTGAGVGLNAERIRSSMASINHRLRRRPR